MSAAKSRANRKALMDEMARTIKQLRLENAALTVQINAMRESANNSIELAPIECCSAAPLPWLPPIVAPQPYFDSQTWIESRGGFYDDALTSDVMDRLLDAQGPGDDVI